MSPVYATRRRAEQFHRVVEGSATPDPRDTGVLELVSQLRDVTPAEPRADFSAALRAELLAAADTLLLPSDEAARLTLPTRRSARDRRLAAFVGGVAVVGASSSLAVAAQSALPGEMLYPLKRALESAETGIRVSDEGKGSSLLASATQRLDEIASLSRTDDVRSSTQIAETLVTFSDQATAASDLLLTDYAESGDETSIEELRGFTAESLDTLAQLEGVLPESAHDELVAAAQVLSQIDQAASQACPTCAGGITELPPFLLAGSPIAEPTVVTVPGPVDPVGEAGGPAAGAGTSRGDTGQKGSGSGDAQGSQGGSGDHGGSGSQGDPGSGDVTVDVPDADVPAPDSGSGGDGDGADTTPLDAITDPLDDDKGGTSGGGGDGDGTSGGGGGGGNGGITSGVPSVDDLIGGGDDVASDLP